MFLPIFFFITESMLIAPHFVVILLPVSVDGRDELGGAFFHTVLSLALKCFSLDNVMRQLIVYSGSVAVSMSFVVLLSYLFFCSPSLSSFISVHPM